MNGKFESCRYLLTATKAGYVEAVLRLISHDVVFLLAAQPPMIVKAARNPQGAPGRRARTSRVRYRF